MNDFDKWDKVPLEAGLFILKGHQVVPTESLSEWHDCFAKRWQERIVGRTEIGDQGGYVSTVFLGMDHGWGVNSEGLVFETMVFGLGDHRTVRYSTWDEAEAGHKKIVEEIKKGMEA